MLNAPQFPEIVYLWLLLWYSLTFINIIDAHKNCCRLSSTWEECTWHSTNMGYHLRPVLCTSYIHIVFSHNLFFIYVEWDHFSNRLFDSEVGNFVRIFIKITYKISWRIWYKCFVVCKKVPVFLISENLW